MSEEVVVGRGMLEVAFEIVEQAGEPWATGRLALYVAGGNGIEMDLTYQQLLKLCDTLLASAQELQRYNEQGDTSVLPPKH